MGPPDFSASHRNEYDDISRMSSHDDDLMEGVDDSIEYDPSPSDSGSGSGSGSGSLLSSSNAYHEMSMEDNDNSIHGTTTTVHPTSSAIARSSTPIAACGLGSGNHGANHAQNGVRRRTNRAAKRIRANSASSMSASIAISSSSAAATATATANGSHPSSGNGSNAIRHPPTLTSSSSSGSDGISSDQNSRSRSSAAADDESMNVAASQATSTTTSASSNHLGADGMKTPQPRSSSTTQNGDDNNDRSSTTGVAPNPHPEFLSPTSITQPIMSFLTRDDLIPPEYHEPLLQGMLAREARFLVRSAPNTPQTPNGDSNFTVASASASASAATSSANGSTVVSVGLPQHTALISGDTQHMESRRQLINFLGCIVYANHLPDEVLFKTVEFMDRIESQGRVRSDLFELLGITCLWLSHKAVGVDEDLRTTGRRLTSTDLMFLSQGRFVQAYFCEMERFVFRRLGFELHGHSARFYAETVLIIHENHFLAAAARSPTANLLIPSPIASANPTKTCPAPNENTASRIACACLYLLELSLLDVEFSTAYLPSERAACAIVLAVLWCEFLEDVDLQTICPACQQCAAASSADACCPQHSVAAVGRGVPSIEWVLDMAGIVNCDRARVRSGVELLWRIHTWGYSVTTPTPSTSTSGGVQAPMELNVVLRYQVEQFLFMSTRKPLPLAPSTNTSFVRAVMSPPASPLCFMPTMNLPSSVVPVSSS